MQNQAGGFGAPYEYAVAERMTPMVRLKRILLIVCYLMWAVGNVITVIMFRQLTAFFAFFIPISMFFLIGLTWKRTYVEYEFSFFGDTLTVSRILGKKTRKKMVELSIRELSMIVPYDDDHVSQIEGFGVQKKLFAISSMDADSLYALLWKENDVKYMLCMEPNDRALKLLRYHNISAFRQ